MTPRILIVDDSRYIRELLTLHLSNAGYEVVAAEDPVAALKFLLQERPSLMLVDVDMPYMNGFELLNAVKGDPAYSSLPVLFLTAREDVEDRAKALGARACLHKPLFVQDLLTAVAAVADTGRIPIG
jgi:CheY-like chemotaxis protein